MKDNLSPENEKITHKGLSTLSLVCAITSLMILLCIVGVGYSCYNTHIETRQGRMAGIDFPQKTEGFTIKSVDSYWKSTAKDSRLALRARYCPCVQIKLCDINSSGVLYCTFANSENKFVGNLISLYFTPSGFVDKSDSLVQAHGDTATIMLEQGFVSDADFAVHRIDESQPLWRLAIDYRMSDSNERNKLGFTSIKPIKQEESND